MFLRMVQRMSFQCTVCTHISLLLTVTTTYTTAQALNTSPRTHASWDECRPKGRGTLLTGMTTNALIELGPGLGYVFVFSPFRAMDKE